MLLEHASSRVENARKRNGECVVRNGRNARWEEHRDGGPLVLQGGNDARQRSSMSSEAGAKELRRKKRALSTCGKNNTRESKPQPDHRLLAISSRRDTWCLRTPVSAPFHLCCFLSRPAKDTRGEIRPEVSWKFFLLILVVLSWDRVVNNLTVDRASDRRWIEISREGRNIKEF